jgi:hypothetical protein
MASPENEGRRPVRCFRQRIINRQQHYGVMKRLLPQVMHAMLELLLQTYELGTDSKCSIIPVGNPPVMRPWTRQLVAGGMLRWL